MPPTNPTINRGYSSASTLSGASIARASSGKKQKRRKRKKCGRHRRLAKTINTRVDNHRVSGSVVFQGGYMTVSDRVILPPAPVQALHLVQSTTITVL